jgi:alkylresorcinol/alkylpyrone synthase
VAPSLKSGAVQITTRSNLSAILGLEVAVPSRWYSQGELLKSLRYEGDPQAESMFTRSAVDGRHLSATEEELSRTVDPRFQHDFAAEKTLFLAEQALRPLVRQLQLQGRVPAALVVHTTSVFQTPSLATQLVARLKLPRTLVRYDLVGAGCYGSIPTLQLADTILQATNDGVVLAATTEVGSHFMGPAPVSDKGRMVINALFGDAAVAMAIGRGEPQPGVPEILAFYSEQDYDSLELVSIKAKDTGSLRPFIDREVPATAAKLVIPALRRFLTQQGYDLRQINHWIFHPGGRTVLDALQVELDLPDDAMEPSRETLRRFGNVSSSTALLALRTVQARRKPKSGDLGLLVAVGPGLIAGFTLLRWT